MSTIPSRLTTPTTTLELHIQCRKLLKKDKLSQSDPFCVIHEVPASSSSSSSSSSSDKEKISAYRTRVPPRDPARSETEVGRTEIIIDTANPDFVKPIRLPYRFEQEQVCCLRVYDEDRKNDASLRHHDYLGGFYFSIGQVLGSKGNSLARPLVEPGRRRSTKRNKKTTNGPYAIVQAEAAQESNQMLEFQLSGSQLANMDGVFSKSDPFYVWKRLNPDGQTWNTVHKSPVIRNNLNPQWNPDRVSIPVLCNGDYHRKLQIQLVDWDRDGSHDDMGCIETTVHELIAAASPKLYPVTRKSRRGKTKKAGTLTVRYARIKNDVTMLDYIRGGCEISLMVAVDFTLSNGKPSNPDSLHYYNPNGGGWNEYQRAITKLGAILQDYDTNKLFPIWGFGAKKDGVGQPCFSLMPHEVYGAQGLLDAYNQTFTIPGFGLSGPTNFVPILREAHDRAMEARQRLLATKKDQNKKQEYNVLVILTDGVISDMAKTVDKICEIAASAPLSIVIVGVGKANFDAMERLDGDDGNRLCNSQGRLAARDIVQFVPFRQCAGNADRLAAETLKEVPQQLVQYFQQLGIQPNPPIPVPDYTEEEIFLDNDFQDGEDIIVGEDEIHL